MGYFKVYTTFNKSLGQTAPSARKCPKNQFWGLLSSFVQPKTARAWEERAYLH